MQTISKDLFKIYNTINSYMTVKQCNSIYEKIKPLIEFLFYNLFDDLIKFLSIIKFSS